MAHRSQPKRAKPCAPVTRRLWPETLSLSSGAAKGIPNLIAACTMVFAIEFLETTAPTTLGKRGRSQSGTPLLNRAGNLCSKKHQWSQRQWTGHDEIPTDSQQQRKVLAIPTASVSVLLAGRCHLTEGLPLRGRSSSKSLARVADSSTSRHSHQEPAITAARGFSGPPSTQGSLREHNEPNASSGKGLGRIGPPKPLKHERL